MFTVEFEDDASVITVLDQTGELEDVSVILYDDYCHVRQWNEKTQEFDVIVLNAMMYYELMKAWDCKEGAYIVERADE